MDLASALAPPRLRQLAGSPVWVRPLDLGGFALLLAWLDDVLPGKPDRVVPPDLNSPEASAALESAPGRAVLAYAVLRREGMPYKTLAALAREADPVEWAAFLSAAFAGRRTAKDDDTPGHDIARAWFGPNLANLCERFPGYTLDAAARLTLDQYALLAGEGLPEEDPRHLTAEQVESMRQEGLRRQREAAGEGAEIVATDGEAI